MCVCYLQQQSRQKFNEAHQSPGSGAKAGGDGLQAPTEHSQGTFVGAAVPRGYTVFNMQFPLLYRDGDNDYVQELLVFGLSSAVIILAYAHILEVGNW